MPSSVSAGPESEVLLLRRYHDGDLSVRDGLVRTYMPLARRLAGRYRHTGESQDDLEQVAYLGLIKAIDRYDSDLGPFARYAVPNIMGELKRHFRDKGWGIHVPRSLQERCLKINQAVEELSGRLGRSPSALDLAKHTGFTLDEVSEAPHPGDSDGDRTLGDSLGDNDPGFEYVELGSALAPAFKALPRREQTILHLRFIEDLTQSEIAERVGLSQMHVSRLLRRSLERLSAAAERQAR